jgi:hypothetical protein
MWSKVTTIYYIYGRMPVKYGDIGLKDSNGDGGVLFMTCL